MHPELAVLSRSNYRAPRVSQNKLTFDFMVRSSEQFFLHCSLNSLNSVRSVSKVLLFDNLESLERTSLDLLLRKLLTLKLTSFRKKDSKIFEQSWSQRNTVDSDHPIKEQVEWTPYSREYSNLPSNWDSMSVAPKEYLSHPNYQHFDWAFTKIPDC